MFKSTAKASQFMERSGSFSTRGSRTGAAPDGYAEPEALTPKQRRDVLVARKTHLIEKITAINNKLKPRLSYDQAVALAAERDEIKAEMRAIDDQMPALNSELRRYAGGDIGNFIVDVVRENMTKPQFEMILKEARRRFDAQESKAE